MSFLDDTHKHGILRQDGATYQFRHIELQHRLANRHDNDHLNSGTALPNQLHHNP